jgi:hypothetical protein
MAFSICNMALNQLCIFRADQGRISKGDDDLFLNRKMLQTAAQAPSTSQSTSTPSGPITQQQITDQVQFVMTTCHD